ncbi:PDC sensor domain-containing protein [Rhodococcoides kroppenstedtii]|uniref:PDC sensor domain-containing protein n=1 Tax=Rhodococcoides kroppenstedtii TaxID=293050 RepID=UPI0036256B93
MADKLSAVDLSVTIGALVNAVSEDCIDVAEAIALDLSGTRPGARPPQSLPHLMFRAQTVLSRSGTPLLGMGFVGDNRAFDGRVLHWWYKPEIGASAQPLEVSTQPAMIDYYDVVNTEWWAAALAGDATEIAGPYVDYSGTNAYILTFARAVRHGGAVVGVVAADIAVGELQTRWQHDLLRAPKPTSVVNEDGVVIATNSGRLLGGVVDLGRRRDIVRTRVPGCSWLLIHGPADGR